MPPDDPRRIDPRQAGPEEHGCGGPARDYIPRLLPDVLEGRIVPSPVLDLALPLERTPDGYRRMDVCTALKVVLTPPSRNEGLSRRPAPAARCAR